MKLILYTLLASVTALQAEVDFVPTFDDKPVPANQAEEIEAALPESALVTPAAPRRVLVFSATQGFRHKSIPVGKMALERLGEQTGAYETVISDDPANFEPEALKSFDAVVLLSPTGDFFMPRTWHKVSVRDQYTDEQWALLQKRNDRLVDNLVRYVEAGGGLMGIHAATDCCYNHEEYGRTIGGYFDGHPWNAKTRVTIVVEDPEHATIRPVFAGIDDFELVEEIYQFKPEPYSRERLRILLHLDPERSEKVKGLKREDNDYAVAWVQSVGKGRVFYTSLGHNDHIYTNPLLLKHYLAGIQFAVGDLKADTTPSAKVDVPMLRETGEWRTLFDGKTLDGWTQRGGKATYEVRDGTIVGISKLMTPNSFLCTDEIYGDFELEFEVLCGRINSGVQIRSKPELPNGKSRVNGPQVEIEHSPGQAGFIYGEAYSRSWRSPEPKSKDPAVNSHAYFKNDEWNHYRVVAEGPRIRTWINGEPVADLVDEETYKSHPEGFLGLQVHSHRAAGVEIKWRNIRIRELTP